MKPFNRYITINPIEVEESGPSILVPDDFKIKKASFIKAVVVDYADDVSIALKRGQTIVVNSAMTEEILLDGKTHHLVLENYVMGLI
tara:strand:- start:5646 stop:5906 length:261 start_codon:yes stop_codon:yes gene_type:complete